MSIEQLAACNSRSLGVVADYSLAFYSVGDIVAAVAGTDGAAEVDAVGSTSGPVDPVDHS